MNIELIPTLIDQYRETFEGEVTKGMCWITDGTAQSAVLGAIEALTPEQAFAAPLTVQSFLMQRALQGWCPPVPILRRLGVRTQTEIERERYALKALRGDFREVSEQSDATRVLEAVS